MAHFDIGESKPRGTSIELDTYTGELITRLQMEFHLWVFSRRVFFIDSTNHSLIVINLSGVS